MYRQSKKNDEFNIFFKEFKEKNKDKWASIVNGMDIDDELLQKELKSDTTDENEMLKQFEKRRKFESAYKTVSEIEDKSKVDPKKGLREQKDPAKPKESMEQHLEPNPEIGETFDPTKFNMIFLHADMICNITRLNRIYNRRVLIYIGNRNGLISYAVGRGPLYEDAWLNAYKEIRKNLISIDLDPQMTCPKNLQVRFNDFRLKIYSSNNPNLWGNPVMCLMLRYAGLYHVGFTIISREKKPHAMIYAFFKAVSKNITKDQYLELTGEKSYREYIGRPRRYDRINEFGNNL